MEPADPADPSSRYALHAPLGQGAFGQVFRATQLATGRAVAVKVIALADGDAAELAEIEKEIAMMRNLPSEFVPELLEGAVWDGGVWIVMELMDGGSCADVLASHSRFSESAAAVVLRDVLRALKYLHGTGRIHRDIKAANILLSTTGQVKLADFGVAGQLQSLRISKTHTTVGTPNWMAPEVILGSGHDGKADIWSLGITAIELATGRVPHGGKPPMQVFKLIPTAPAPVLQGEYSDELKDFVARCLKKNPRERPSAADLLGHPFIASVENSAVLEVLVKESKVIREQDKERKEDGGKKRGKKQQGQAKGNGLGLGVDRKAEPRLAEPPLPSPAQPLRPPLPTTLQPALQSNEHSHSAQRRVATAPPARSSLARSPDRALKSVRILLPDDASSGSGSATSGSSRSAASRENFTWSTQGDASNLNAGETDRFFDAIGMVRPWARTSTHPVLDSLEHVLDKLKGADPGLYGRLLGSLGLPSNVPSSTKPPEGSYMYRRWRDKVRRRETVVDNH